MFIIKHLNKLKFAPRLVFSPRRCLPDVKSGQVMTRRQDTRDLPLLPSRPPDEMQEWFSPQKYQIPYKKAKRSRFLNRLSYNPKKSHHPIPILQKTGPLFNGPVLEFSFGVHEEILPHVWLYVGLEPDRIIHTRLESRASVRGFGFDSLARAGFTLRR